MCLNWLICIHNGELSYRDRTCILIQLIRLPFLLINVGIFTPQTNIGTRSRSPRMRIKPTYRGCDQLNSGFGHQPRHARWSIISPRKANQLAPCIYANAGCAHPRAHVLTTKHPLQSTIDRLKVSRKMPNARVSPSWCPSGRCTAKACRTIYTSPIDRPIATV